MGLGGELFGFPASQGAGSPSKTYVDGCFFLFILVISYQCRVITSAGHHAGEVVLPNPTNRRRYNKKKSKRVPLRQLFSSTHRNPEFTSQP
jgi:hypothetical protein